MPTATTEAGGVTLRYAQGKKPPLQDTKQLPGTLDGRRSWYCWVNSHWAWNGRNHRN